MCFAFLYQREEQQQRAVVTTVSVNPQDSIQLDFNMCIHQGSRLRINACRPAPPSAPVMHGDSDAPAQHVVGF